LQARWICGSAAVLVFVAVVVGTASGASEPEVEELPPGVVATVAEVPGGFGTITVRELRRAIIQVSAQRGTSPAPAPGEPHYRRVAKLALAESLDVADIEGEGAERDIAVSARQVARRLAAIKREFNSKVEFHKYLRRLKLSENEARERVRLQILVRRIETDVYGGLDGAAAQAKAKEFVEAYRKRWRARTICAPEYAIGRCSNGSARSGP